MNELGQPIAAVLLVAGFWFLWRCVNSAAVKAELVYLARHRDHAKVPSMYWKDRS